MQKVHLKAQDNWINDPNGFIYYKGKYHLFYQCFPYAPRWGRMHWGHAISDDLVHWEHKRIALYPSKVDDRSGCFSGSAVENNGTLYLFYTGVNYLIEDPEDINLSMDEQFISAQMMIISEDGITFDNIHNKKTIIPVIEDPEIGDRRHTRDPKVWREDDGWYMILGSTIDDRVSRLLFYRSDDLERWSFINSVRADGLGWGIECPDYFKIDNQGILICSPMGIMKEGKQDPNQTICMFAEFNKKDGSMQLSEDWRLFDYGMDLYAPQSTIDGKERTVIAWARMPKSVDNRWDGMFCIPRLVKVKNHHIYYEPHPNIKDIFTKRIHTTSEANKAGYRLLFDMEDGDEINIGGYIIFRKGNRIHTDRSRLYKEFPDCRTKFETPDLKDGCHLDVYVDHNLVEVFVNNGEYVITNIVYNLGSEINFNDKTDLEMYTTE